MPEVCAKVAPDGMRSMAAAANANARQRLRRNGSDMMSAERFYANGIAPWAHNDIVVICVIPDGFCVGDHYGL